MKRYLDHGYKLWDKSQDVVSSDLKDVNCVMQFSGGAAVPLDVVANFALVFVSLALVEGVFEYDAIDLITALDSATKSLVDRQSAVKPQDCFPLSSSLPHGSLGVTRATCVAYTFLC